MSNPFKKQQPQQSKGHAHTVKDAVLGKKPLPMNHPSKQRSLHAMEVAAETAKSEFLKHIPAETADTKKALELLDVALESATEALKKR